MGRAVVALAGGPGREQAPRRRVRLDVLADDDQSPIPNAIQSKYLTAGVDDPAQNIYAQAYVRPLYDLKSDKTPPFKRNIANEDPTLEAQLLAGRGTATKSGPGYWAAYLQVGFQMDEPFEPILTVRATRV